jgi:hypothetical protein
MKTLTQRFRAGLITFARRGLILLDTKRNEITTYKTNEVTTSYLIMNQIGKLRLPSGAKETVSRVVSPLPRLGSFPTHTRR